jgi:hypothetical protein
LRNFVGEVWESYVGGALIRNTIPYALPV